VHGAAKVHQPQAKNAAEKRLEAAPLRIKGADGFLNPKECLLLGVFEIPRAQPTAGSAPDQARSQFAPASTRQFIAGGSAISLPGEQDKDFVACVVQVQEPTFFVGCRHGLVASFAVKKVKFQTSVVTSTIPKVRMVPRFRHGSMPARTTSAGARRAGEDFVWR
jgi:hypothetical protein